MDKMDILSSYSDSENSWGPEQNFSKIESLED